jgi:hypothetical protein
MSSLARTISNALAAVGPSTESRLRSIVEELGALNLSEEDRLAVLATAIAATAATYHARHKTVYLDAVRTWALEISGELQPGPLRLLPRPADGPVEDGAEILLGGLEAVMEAMSETGVAIQDRLVTELALLARLLGQYDANTIHQTLLAVGRALDAVDYRPGRRVDVPVREAWRFLTRDVPLEALDPRGVA